MLQLLTADKIINVACMYAMCVYYYIACIILCSCMCAGPSYFVHMFVNVCAGVCACMCSCVCVHTDDAFLAVPSGTAY